MPLRKRRIIPDESDDEEAGPSQSQSTQNRTQLAPTELNSLANDLVHYALVCDQRKLPIKQTDMRKQVLKEKSSAFKSVLEIAREKLTKIFGMTLTAIDGRTGQYMLINKLTDESETSVLMWSEEEQIKNCLLFIILSAIFMNENVMSDEQLWLMLKKFGIDADLHHSEFGDIRKLINNEFKQQMYLDVTKNTSTEPASYEYRWGIRALTEISKKQVLDFVCTLYPDTTPENWIQQLKDAETQNQSS